jgi:hypothetical protein
MILFPPLVQHLAELVKVLQNKPIQESFTVIANKRAMMALYRTPEAIA